MIPTYTRTTILFYFFVIKKNLEIFNGSKTELNKEEIGNKYNLRIGWIKAERKNQPYNWNKNMISENLLWSKFQIGRGLGFIWFGHDK